MLETELEHSALAKEQELIKFKLEYAQEELIKKDEMILNLHEQLKRLEEAGRTYAIQRNDDVKVYKEQAEMNGNKLLYAIKSELQELRGMIEELKGDE